MPTGYTAELMEKGQSFEEFAMRCARAFGALVEMRDEPLDAPIKEFTPSPHYTESLAKYTKELARLQAMTNDEKIAFGVAAKAAEIKRNREWLAKDQAENARLLEMEAKVLGWIPPTKDHDGIKDFMLEQINISKNGCDYIERKLSELEAKSPGSFYAEAVGEQTRGIEYATENLQKEIDRTSNRNEWVKQLRESLKLVVA